MTYYPHATAATDGCTLGPVWKRVRRFVRRASRRFIEDTRRKGDVAEWVRQTLGTGTG